MSSCPNPPVTALPHDAIVQMERLVVDFALGPLDLLLIGDGSGTIHTEPAGWACTAYDRCKLQVVLHAGAVTSGTNNFAELVPYAHALWHHHQAHGQAPVTPVRVSIVLTNALPRRNHDPRVRTKDFGRRLEHYAHAHDRVAARHSVAWLFHFRKEIR